MDKEHLQAIKKLKEILEPITKEVCHKSNVELARITLPLSHIPYKIKPEEWVPLELDDFALDRYLVSTWGRIYDKKYNNYPKQHLCEKGHVRMAIEKRNSFVGDYSRTIRLHRIIALTFVPKVEGKNLVKHINNNIKQNTANNLKWADDKENLYNTHNTIRKGKYKYFTKEQVQTIRQEFINGNKKIDIAKKYNRDYKTICDIINYKTYKDDFWDKLGFPHGSQDRYRIKKI